MIHVFPLEDSEGHHLDSTCHCLPAAELTEDGEIMLTHNAFDRRESYEKFGIVTAGWIIIRGQGVPEEQTENEMDGEEGDELCLEQ